jgi:Replication-relaxation
MRVIDREQAKTVAGFNSTTRANARLLALTHGKYLHRFFWGSVGGARKALYSMSPRGAELAGVPYRRPRHGQDQVLAVDSLSAHQLEVNEIYCTVKYRPLPDGAKLVFKNRLTARSFRTDTPRLKVKPDCYRSLSKWIALLKASRYGGEKCKRISNTPPRAFSPESSMHHRFGSWWSRPPSPE